MITFLVAFLLGFAAGLFARYISDETNAILPGDPDDWYS